MTEVVEEIPTTVLIQAPDGVEFSAILTATPTTDVELERYVAAVGGWGRVTRHKAGNSNWLSGDTQDGSSVSIDLHHFTPPPPVPTKLMEIDRKIKGALEAGDGDESD